MKKALPQAGELGIFDRSLPHRGRPHRPRPRPRPGRRDRAPLRRDQPLRRPQVVPQLGAVSRLLLEHLPELDPRYPKADLDVEEARRRLLEQ
ncbi:hypothetical protein [Streptomyces canus]|uniref:hypothetical protein n=1 Tax=Streptomyces canus TaxID=58343 RepID=UPI0030E06647